MDFELTDEHRRIQDTMREFGEREIKPHVARRDREQILPLEVVRQLGCVESPTRFSWRLKSGVPCRWRD